MVRTARRLLAITLPSALTRRIANRVVTRSVIRTAIAAAVLLISTAAGAQPVDLAITGITDSPTDITLGTGHGSSASFTTTVTVTPEVAGTNILNASVTANESDPVPANNSDSETTTVNGTIDLAITGITDSPNDNRPRHQ